MRGGIKMKEKYFKVKWKRSGGCIEYLRGTSLSQALLNSGYVKDAGCLVELYMEAVSLPPKLKEVILVDSNGDKLVEFMYNQRSQIADAIRELIDERDPDFNSDIIEVELINEKYKYKVSVEPFMIVCEFIDHVFCQNGVSK